MEKRSASCDQIACNNLSKFTAVHVDRWATDQHPVIKLPAVEYYLYAPYRWLYVALIKKSYVPHIYSISFMDLELYMVIRPTGCSTNNTKISDEIDLWNLKNA